MTAAALLLDLDGLLVDANAVHAEAIARAACDLGMPLPRSTFDRVIGEGGDVLVADVFGPEVEDAHGDALREAMGRHFQALAAETSLAVFSGAERLVRAARERGMKVALATSSADKDLDATFESAGVDFRDLVDVTVTATDADTSKPAPDVVTAAARKLGVPPVACVLVGDTVYDAEAARRAGAAFVGVASWVWSDRELREAGARAVYASTAALADDLDGALGAAAPGETPLASDPLDALMTMAVDEARAALSAGDLPVGAVVGRSDGTILARGRNHAQDHQLRHAETEALAALGDTDRPGLILATTLEPCAMCLGAAMEAGLHAVVYALEAPPNGAAGRLLPPSGRTLPLVALHQGAGGTHRDASLDLLRQSDQPFARRLVVAIEKAGAR